MPYLKVTLMAKYPNPMLVKASRTYDVLEAARALGRTPATIRHWIKDGLEVLAARKPYLILGQAIRNYIRAKSASRKKPLSQDEIYCLSCKAGRRPLDMVVTLHSLTSKTYRINGVCDTCAAPMSRIISSSKAPQFLEVFTLKKNRGSTA
ncbi:MULTISPECIES: DNA-binding protein [unclassified Ruegeria]|uniref:DNA-binding protein n=1 Tax=unclassified Ruegeria TaxID=2625375 RepID=UPI001488D338|nr:MULTISPECIES: DNA-binding protein [unclassified Ruegeria]